MIVNGDKATNHAANIPIDGLYKRLPHQYVSPTMPPVSNNEGNRATVSIGPSNHIKPAIR